MSQNIFCKYCHRIPNQCNCTHPVKEHFEDEPQAEELHEIMQSNTHPVKEPDFTVEKDSQDWKGMDGATAFWLIERHSNHWDDARLMMEEWLEANSHPVKEQDESFDRTASHMAGEYVSYKLELTDEEILQTWKEFDDNDADNWFIEIARAILRKASEK